MLGTLSTAYIRRQPNTLKERITKERQKIKENEEIILRARTKMDTRARCRRVEDRVDVKNTYVHCWTRQAQHAYASNKVQGTAVVVRTKNII